MRIRVFKNGNISIQREKTDTDMFQDVNLIVAFATFFSVDFLHYACAGNDEMYQEICCYDTGFKYRILCGRDQLAFEQGKTVKLFALQMEDEDLQIIENNHQGI